MNHGKRSTLCSKTASVLLSYIFANPSSCILSKCTYHLNVLCFISLAEYKYKCNLDKKVGFHTNKLGFNTHTHRYTLAFYWSKQNVQVNIYCRLLHKRNINKYKATIMPWKSRHILYSRSQNSSTGDDSEHEYRNQISICQDLNHYTVHSKTQSSHTAVKYNTPVFAYYEIT